MNRKALSPRTNQTLRAHYGDKKAVVCTLCLLEFEPKTRTVEFHHMDDDSSETVFENLLPLCGPHNKLLEIYRLFEIGKAQNAPPSDKFSTPALHKASYQLYREGRAVLSCAVARIGIWMARSYPNRPFSEKPKSTKNVSSDLWLCLSQSIRSASYTLKAEALILDILRRDGAFLAEKHAISNIEYDELLMQLAAVLQMYGDTNNSKKLLAQIINPSTPRISGRVALGAIIDRDSELFKIAYENSVELNHRQKDHQHVLRAALLLAWYHMNLEGNASAAKKVLGPLRKQINQNETTYFDPLYDPMFTLEFRLTWCNIMNVLCGETGWTDLETESEKIEDLATILKSQKRQLRPSALEVICGYNGRVLEPTEKMYYSVSKPIKVSKEFTANLHKESKKLIDKVRHL